MWHIEGRRQAACFQVPVLPNTTKEKEQRKNRSFVYLVLVQQLSHTYSARIVSFDEKLAVPAENVGPLEDDDEVEDCRPRLPCATSDTFGDTSQHHHITASPTRPNKLNSTFGLEKTDTKSRPRTKICVKL